MPEITVIIPTLNRADYLKTALESLREQTLSNSHFEVIVVDNGSQDNTLEVTEHFIRNNNINLRYVLEKNYGLHNGRHRGAVEAKSEILSYIDDDVIVTKAWLQSIKEAFSDGDVSLVGGKILPHWEGDIPHWLNSFKYDVDGGWAIGYLSLLDLGDRVKRIPAHYVYGCNFSIRKSILYECGGFNPDGMPQELIKYRGNGESALSEQIMNKNNISLYVPSAAVFHRIPEMRLTIEYFCRRAYNQGISDSFSEIRKAGALTKQEKENRDSSSFINRLKQLLTFSPVFSEEAEIEKNNIQKQVREAYQKGKAYHRSQVEKDPHLLKYVLKDNYFKD